MFWRFNDTGAFLWGKVFENGRVYIRADYKFTRQTIEACAESIHRKSAELGLGRFSAVYADPEMFPSTTGKKERRSALEPEAPAHTFSRFGLPMIRSGEHREHGWQRVHEYLRIAPDGHPWLIIHPECVTLLRTLPTLVKQENHPDDCQGDEYAANALRFLLASRPSTSKIAKKPTVYPWGSLGWLKQLDARESRVAGVLSR